MDSRIPPLQSRGFRAGTGVAFLLSLLLSVCALFLALSFREHLARSKSTPGMHWGSSVPSVVHDVGGGVLALTAILFLVWFDRAHRNAVALNPDLRRRESNPLVWWFVPLVNLWMPYYCMQRIASWSSPDRGPDSRVSRYGVPVIVLWWLASVSAALLDLLGRSTGYESRRGAAQAAAEWFAWSRAAAIVAAVLAIRVVKVVHDLQVRKHRKLHDVASVFA